MKKMKTSKKMKKMENILKKKKLPKGTSPPETAQTFVFKETLQEIVQQLRSKNEKKN